ncbi:TonB-dependent receptor [Herminiimonas sp.]|uniref:TonB-dependent receptor n=1 Tax=Herminiimonas sp. TaxID=1926289 RepID=UPI00351E284C
MSSHNSSPIFKQTLLACALQAALPMLTGAALLTSGAAFAQTADPTKTTELAEIVVTSSADASAEGLSKPYAGGQVARGGRAGILGTQDNMDTPFSITSYTNEFIQNQQARSVGDVLQSDPSVRVARGFGNFQESYFIRGFIVNSDDIAYNGLYGLLPRQYISSELFERVEVLKGASGFLTGATPSGGGVGGNINLLPKRAPNEPLTRVSIGTASGSQFYASGDIARRFGPNQETGIRINAAHRSGGTAVDREHVELNVVSVGLDWHSRDVRLSADIGHQEHSLNESRPNVTPAAGLTSIPAPANNKTNFAQPWTYSDERETFGSFRGEYDINAKTTAWFAAGAKESYEANSLAGVNLSNSTTGAGTASRFDNTREDSVKTAEFGLRSKVTTGSVGHELVAAFSYFDFEKKNAYATGAASATNIYNPISFARPALSSFGNDLANPALNGTTTLKSLAIGDTMSFYEDKVRLTLGVRHQNLESTSISYRTVNGLGVVTGPGGVTSGYEKSRNSPVLGLVIKPSENISVYANYIESLAQGDTAPTTSGGVTISNPGTQFAPYVSKQKEIGLKYDAGRFGANIAAFSTEKPRSAVIGNVFTAEGKDRHQGVELSVYGEATKGLKLLGGVTFLDAKQLATGNANLDGKRVIGTPSSQASLGAEWDVPGLQGLTLDARTTATGAVYANAANTQKVSGWARLDVGARYLTEVQGRLLTLRARVDNVTDRDYWSSVGGYPGSGYMVLSNPRTFTLTASIDF